MKTTKINNSVLKRDLNEIIKTGKNFSLGGVSGYSIEYMENDYSFSSLTYYDNKKQRDEDFNTIMNLLKETENA